MRKPHAYSKQLPHLRALPAFAVAARTGSLTVAADELHVTPGAVSRQVKTLEDSLGVRLFNRSHNAIVLTEAGTRFLHHVNAALTMLEEGARTLHPQATKLVVQAPITFARRWLIPRIRSFSELYPGTDISIRSLALGASETADIEIGYARTPDLPADAQVILRDTSLAVCAPRLMALLGREPTFEGILDLPILLDTEDGWSWRCWCELVGLNFKSRSGSIALDTDEASIDACLSGLGIAQASPVFVESELRSGQLVAPRPDVVAEVGAYYLTRPPASKLGVAFQAWLESARF